jgi:hypothetical protein
MGSVAISVLVPFSTVTRGARSSSASAQPDIESLSIFRSVDLSLGVPTPRFPAEVPHAASATQQKKRRTPYNPAFCGSVSYGTNSPRIVAVQIALIKPLGKPVTRQHGNRDRPPCGHFSSVFAIVPDGSAAIVRPLYGLPFPPPPPPSGSISDPDRPAGRGRRIGRALRRYPFI